MIKGLLIALGLMGLLMVIGYVVTENIAYQLESQDELEQETIDAINRVKENWDDSFSTFIPLFLIAIAFSILAIVGARYGNKNIDYNNIDVDEEIEEYNDAVIILKRRYAMGEIDSFEYTERMSRL